MAQLRTGSLCLTDILAKAKEGHSAFSKAQNGKIYFNVTVWHNEETDKYGNDSSIMLNSHKDKREQEGKVYVGNLKMQAGGSQEQVKSDDLELNADDLPF